MNMPQVRAKLANLMAIYLALFLTIPFASVVTRPSSTESIDLSTSTVDLGSKPEYSLTVTTISTKSNTEQFEDKDGFKISFVRPLYDDDWEDDAESFKFSRYCPVYSQIHPCECIMKGYRGNRTDELVELFLIEAPRQSAIVETVAHCTNVNHPEVLYRAIRGFQGHRLSFLTIESCRMPPLPSNMFVGMQVKWLEVINTVIMLKQEMYSQLFSSHILQVSMSDGVIVSEESTTAHHLNNQHKIREL